jgi:hypothetical protein
MPVRRLPVRPDLDQLHRQAKELLRDIHAGDATATCELHELHPESIDPTAARLADAQLVLARSYRASSWTRLSTPCNSPTRSGATMPTRSARSSRAILL